jgi:RNA polymerase sigma factor (sigma-70 family)
MSTGGSVPPAGPLSQLALRLLGDRQLVRLAARGHEAAFEAIFRRYHQELFRYCRGILRDPNEAEDALQSTMAAVLKALPEEPREIALRPWLHRIAHNEAVSMMRRRVELADPDSEAEPAGPGADSQAEARERLRQLVADLEGLPERQRAALLLREASGLSYAEIGDALELSATHARQTVYEARVALRELKGGREMECGDVRRALSEGDRRVLRGRRLRAHLRACEGCRDFRDAIERRRSDLEGLCPPLPPAAASALLAAALGEAKGTGAGVAAGSTTAAGAAGAGSGAGAAGATIAASAAVKGAAVVAGAALGAGVAGAAGVMTPPWVPDSSKTEAADMRAVAPGASPEGPWAPRSLGGTRAIAPGRSPGTSRPAAPPRHRVVGPRADAGDPDFMGPNGAGGSEPIDGAPGMATPPDDAPAQGDEPSSPGGAAEVSAESGQPAGPVARPAQPGPAPGGGGPPPQAGEPGGPPQHAVGSGRSPADPGHAGGGGGPPPQAGEPGGPPQHAVGSGRSPADPGHAGEGGGPPPQAGGPAHVPDAGANPPTTRGGPTGHGSAGGVSGSPGK